MRMSCNGCRVLRKGCSDDCTIRPCLQWIKSPDAQSNATLFLAKFYGRAGLINLIEAGPEHLRPAIFRSLLYEACGRIVDPVNGSVGLLWSGNWPECHAAVDAVLKGLPMPSPSSDAPPHLRSLLKTCDIRHVTKDPAEVKNRTRINRPISRTTTQAEIMPWLNPADLSFEQRGNGDSSKDEQSMLSAETVEAFLVHKFESDDSQVGLDLTLGLVSM